MADAVATQKLVDGAKNVVMKFTNVSDGTGESAVVKVDVSALNDAPERVKIVAVHWKISGMTVRVLWDATTDVDALILTEGEGHHCYRKFGGIQNNAGDGVTGDISFTTSGASINDSYDITLEMQKS